MPLSMTGYGRAVALNDGREITVELKSVNHRFLDVGFKMPRVFVFLENDMRAQIASRLTRGHVDVFVTYNNTRNDTHNVRIDLGLLDAFINALRQGGEHAGLADNLRMTDIMRMDDVLVIEDNAEDQAALRALMTQALDGALDELESMRRREGETLKRDLLLKLDKLEKAAALIDEREPVWLNEYREKLRARVEEITQTQLDEARLSQEIALIADKAAVDEETVRLRSHISQMRGLLEADEPVGRKLDFLVQEMNREVNTTGSKSGDLTITDIVVNAKNDIEKIREQVQNIE